MVFFCIPPIYCRVVGYVTDWLELTAEVEDEDRVRLYVTSGLDVIYAED